MGVTQSTGIQIKDATVAIVDLSATGIPSATTFLRGDNVWATPVVGAGGSGITRSINSITAATTGAATANVDYVYLANGTFTFTLPSAVGNTDIYTIKNIGIGTITITTTAAQTIDTGAAPITITRQNSSLDFISNGANWFLI